MKIIVCLWFVLGALSAAGKVIFTTVGQRATLECGAVSFKNSLEWRQGDDRIVFVDKKGFPRHGKAAVQTRSKRRGDTDLDIFPVRKEDAGTFTCTADGNPQVHTLLVGSVSVSPPAELKVGSNATLLCEIEGLNPDSVKTVQWIGVDKNVRSRTAQLENVALTDAGTWKCQFSHGGETFSTQLEIKVTEPATKTTPAPKQSSKVNGKKINSTICAQPSCADSGVAHWWMWVAIGAGCLVVVLLMVSVIVLYKRIRRRKRNLHLMKNGRQAQRPRQYCQCNHQTAAAKPQQGRQKGRPSALPLQPLLKE
ncbi:uncharacterized protein LOC108880658 [Lates calcarifer]|uniref:Uncharacterized protein LOC108880658 n=1 Tax=Lates calcarifer TaxID=8187 RepID=A0A4W6CE16_LATCA|nr:uncharacterized protein LOC108880658 [Lates calcarifer]